MKDRLCVLRFSSKSQKMFWNDLLVYYQKQALPPTITDLQLKLAEDYSRSGKATEKHRSLFYKIKNIQDNELIHRVQSLGELTELGQQFAKKHNRNAFVEIQRAIFNRNKTLVPDDTKYFWLSTDQKQQKQPACYIGVGF